MSTANVIKNSFIYIVGNFLSKAWASVVVLLVTRFLRVDEYGELSLVRMFLSLASLTVLAVLSGSFSTIYARLSGRSRSEFVGSSLLFLMTVMAAMVALISPCGDTVLSFLFPKTHIDFFPTVWVGLVSLVFSVPNFILSLVYVLDEKPYHYVGLQLVQMALSTIGIVLFVAILRLSVLGVLLSELSWNFVLSFVCLYYLRGKYTLSFSWKTLRPAVVIGLPLLPLAFWSLIVNQADRYVLEKYSGLTQIGIYSLAAQFGFLMNTVVASISISYNARMLRLFNDLGAVDSAPEMRKMMGPFIGEMVLIFMGLGLFAKEIIIVAFPSTYHDAYQLVALIAFAYLIRGVSLMYEGSFYWSGKLKYFAPQVIISGIVLYGFLIISVPRHGILAASIGWIVFYFLSLAIAYQLSKRISPLGFHKSGFVLIILTGVAVLGIGRWFPAEISVFEIGVKLLLCIVVTFVVDRMGLISVYQIWQSSVRQIHHLWQLIGLSRTRVREIFSDGAK